MLTFKIPSGIHMSSFVRGFDCLCKLCPAELRHSGAAACFHVALFKYPFGWYFVLLGTYGHPKIDQLRHERSCRTSWRGHWWSHGIRDAGRD